MSGISPISEVSVLTTVYDSKLSQLRKIDEMKELVALLVKQHEEIVKDLEDEILRLKAQRDGWKNLCEVQMTLLKNKEVDA